MKKLISLILAVCVLVAPMAASSADTEDNNTDVVHAAETFQIGDYILLGRYYDQPILWRCMDIDENGPLMLTIELCRKEFDSIGKEGVQYTPILGN